jgi:hypothetical protein
VARLAAARAAGASHFLSSCLYLQGKCGLLPEQRLKLLPELLDLRMHLLDMLPDLSPDLRIDWWPGVRQHLLYGLHDLPVH